MTNEMGSTLLVPALRLPALPDAAASAPASQQEARVPLPAYGYDCDVSMDLTAELAGIIDVSEEEAGPCAQAWRFEQTFEARAEQHFGSRLVEYERNMAGGWSEPCGSHECARGCGGEYCPAVTQGNIAFEQRDRALRQTVREEFDSYRAHLAMEMQEDIPAHVEARIADVCDFFRGQLSEGARRVERHAREHCEMFAAAVREEAHRELISIEGSSASRQARVQEELVRARHGEEQSAWLWRIEMANARAQAATEQEAAVACCQSSAAAALDNTRAHAENRCERLEESFVRERDRAAVADLVLADMAAQLRDEQAMVSELQDTALGMQAQVEEFVEQYAESIKRVIDWEFSDVKKHGQYFVENAEALAWHEERVVTELRQELQQARSHVSRGSGLAEQQQRQFESAPMEPLPERLGTLRIKAVSDPFRVSSLAFGSSMPATPEQTHGFVVLRLLLLTLALKLLDGQFLRPGTSTLLMRIRPKNPLARRRIGDGLWLSPSTLAGRQRAQDSRAGLRSSM